MFGSDSGRFLVPGSIQSVLGQLYRYVHVVVLVDLLHVYIMFCTFDVVLLCIVVVLDLATVAMACWSISSGRVCQQVAVML